MSGLHKHQVNIKISGKWGKLDFCHHNAFFKASLFFSLIFFVYASVLFMSVTFWIVVPCPHSYTLSCPYCRGELAAKTVYCCFWTHTWGKPRTLAISLLHMGMESTHHSQPYPSQACPVHQYFPLKQQYLFLKCHQCCKPFNIWISILGYSSYRFRLNTGQFTSFCKINIS